MMAWLDPKAYKQAKLNQQKMEVLQSGIREAKKDGRATVFFCGGWLVLTLAEKIYQEMGGDG
jgi:6-phosphogluconolactonase/glucosamine-6-phosphate isomerase/deaminase